MEKKYLIAAVAGILVLALVIGLVLANGSSSQPADPTQTTQNTTAPLPQQTTGPAPLDTTVPEETGPSAEPSTAPGTEPSTEPSTESTTVPATEPSTEPTKPLTLEDKVNAMSLSAKKTGIDKVDTKTSQILKDLGTKKPYETLRAIYAHIIGQYAPGTSSTTLSELNSFTQDKVFASSSELVVACQGYKLLTQGSGIADNYAAAFSLLARAAGFEAYMVTGRLDGESHIWNLVRLDGTYYIFDTYTEDRAGTDYACFALTDTDRYVCTNRASDIAAQPGFTPAPTFTAKLTLTDDNGTRTHEFTWSFENTVEDALLHALHTIEATGAVEYTLEVNCACRLTNHKAKESEGTTLSGTFRASATGHTLLAKDPDSMRVIEIKIVKG